MLSKIRAVITVSIYFFIINSLHAQLEAHLIDNEGWAKGNYVEIGINSKGVYGANTDNRPQSFHDNREEDGNNIFGFIANPLADNWVDYDGDFFTPGDPEEGFSIEIDGINYNNNNSGSLFEIPGSIKSVNTLSSNCFEDIAQVFWEGNVDGINIKRYYTVTKNGLFIQMTTFIKNITSQDKNNVYFMHNVDPDNNITLTGYYETNMQLKSQASSANDNISLVSASQDALGTPEDKDGSFVSLFSRNELARVSYGGFDNRNAKDIWNGTNYINTEGSSTNHVDQAISIAFNLGNISPNETKKFTYYYILKETDETFSPIIVNVFKENPTLCGANDGKIILSGLMPNNNYNISYLDNGIAIPEQTFIADDNGEIQLSNLDSGTYSNIELNINGCNTTIDTVFELEDPEAPNYYFSKQDLTNCSSINGKLTIHNLTPNANYLISYELNGNFVTPYEMTTNIDGELILSNLDKSIYSNFIIEQYGCATPSTEIIEILGPEITSYSIPEFFYCDDNYDYVTNIDLTVANDFIIGIDNPSDFIITYHESEQTLINNINLPASNYITPGSNAFTLYAKKTHVNNLCYSYVPFTINIDLPADFVLEDTIICLNNDDTINLDYNLPVLTTGLSNTLYNFEWHFENQLIINENLSELTADNFGVYSVSVTDIATGCIVTKSVTVHPSGPPKSVEVNITSDLFSDNQTVEILASGYGDFQYSIDDSAYQISPIFSNISSGLHEFHIQDSNGCGSVTVEKVFIDYMRFFTPNNDNYNDYWQIVGIDNLIEPNIYIYDRYGKQLKWLNQNSKGWDGTYNGKLLPASDYWFKITFIDDNNVPRDFSSHFTLKR